MEVVDLSANEAKSTPYNKGLSGRKAGRPQGSTSTPSALLRGEMKACASTMNKVRKLVEEQVDEVRALLKAAPLADRLNALDTLVSLIEKLNKTMEGGAKYLMTDKSSAAQAADASGDTNALIEKFIGGPQF